MDKALQDAQIKLSGVVSDLFGMSGRAMLDAMVAGERNPRALADLAKGSLVKKKPALIEGLTGQFEDHHARLLRVLPGTVDHLTAQIRELDRLIAHTLEEIITPHDDSPAADPSVGGVSARALAEKLDAVPGIGPATAQIIIAEIGADMSRFPTPEHLVSWAKLCPRTIQSGAKNTAGPAGQGTPWLKGALGEAANAAARDGSNSTPAVGSPDPVYVRWIRRRSPMGGLRPCGIRERGVDDLACGDTGVHRGEVVVDHPLGALAQGLDVRRFENVDEHRAPVGGRVHQPLVPVLDTRETGPDQDEEGLLQDGSLHADLPPSGREVGMQTRRAVELAAV
ncbi:transposase (plasmid) [Embleya sp. NBC_00888]|nr:transposase [Embleya sp. NBC_00888]